MGSVTCDESEVTAGNTCTVTCLAGQIANPPTIDCPSTTCPIGGDSGSCQAPDNGWWVPCGFGTGDCKNPMSISTPAPCGPAPAPATDDGTSPATAPQPVSNTSKSSNAADVAAPSPSNSPSTTSGKAVTASH